MSLTDAARADAAFAQLYEQRRMVGLSAFMTLPPVEPPRITRARLAKFLSEHVAGHGCVTDRDMEAAGFTRDEIATHFTEAKRIAGLAAMAA